MSLTIDWYRDWIRPHMRFPVNQDPLGVDRKEEFYQFCLSRGLLRDASVTRRAMEVYGVMAEKFGSDEFLDNAEYIEDWLLSYEEHKAWFPTWWCHGCEDCGGGVPGEEGTCYYDRDGQPCYEAPRQPQA